MSKTIVSGIRATGKLHIGNYLGALRQFIELQNQGYRAFYFVADLHALTTPFDPKKLKEDTFEVVAEYLSAGLDPNKSTLFLQNHVPAHSELAWIFNCQVSLAELKRMTQFKDKSKTRKDNINAGLLTYPALMTADILIYKANIVPVGEDQTQHIEITRDIARAFNKTYGHTFPEPENIMLKPLRIMSLQEPTKKMSKTNDVPLYLSDTPDEIANKIKKAVTATQGGEQSEGVRNLLFLLNIINPGEHVKTFETQEKNGTIKYSELKTALTESLIEYLKDFRTKKKELLQDKTYIAETLSNGAKEANEVANQTIKEVKAKIGLI